MSIADRPRRRCYELREYWAMTFRLEREVFINFVANLKVAAAAVGYVSIQIFDLGGVVVDCLPVRVGQLVIRDFSLRP